jgi:hypothetical protein
VSLRDERRLIVYGSGDIRQDDPVPRVARRLLPHSVLFKTARRESPSEIFPRLINEILTDVDAVITGPDGERELLIARACHAKGIPVASNSFIGLQVKQQHLRVEYPEDVAVFLTETVRSWQKTKAGAKAATYFATNVPKVVTLT